MKNSNSRKQFDQVQTRPTNNLSTTQPLTSDDFGSKQFKVTNYFNSHHHHNLGIPKTGHISFTTRYPKTNLRHNDGRSFKLQTAKGSLIQLPCQAPLSHGTKHPVVEVHKS